MVSEHIDKDKWVNLNDLLKLRQNVRLLDEGGWEDDTQAVPVEVIKGLAKLDIVRCKDCKFYYKFYGVNMAPSVRSLGYSHYCCRQASVCPVRENDFCSRGARKE